ncbi:MAG TPA: ABC transporter permease [Candidatus Polarisedimenticolia bacterium]
MIPHVARRIVAAIPVLAVALTTLFLLLQMAPGDPFTPEPGTNVSPDATAVRRAFGADRPLGPRYLHWAAGLLTGDLGLSWSLRRPVSDVIGEAARNTGLLMGAAMAAQFALGIAAGVLAASLRGGWVDRVVRVSATALYSVPSYWLGLLLTVLFSVRLGWLPVSQMHAPGAAEMTATWRAWDAARHLVLPWISLTLPAAAGIALLVRETVSDALTRAYVLTARARGSSWGRVVAGHALRNALLPVVGLFGLALPGLVGGSIVMEVLFAWPGMGRLAYQSALARDEPLVLGCAAVTAVLVVMGGLVADLVAAALDPRVRGSLP